MQCRDDAYMVRTCREEQLSSLLSFKTPQRWTDTTKSKNMRLCFHEIEWWWESVFGINCFNLGTLTGLLFICSPIHNSLWRRHSTVFTSGYFGTGLNLTQNSSSSSSSSSSGRGKNKEIGSSCEFETWPGWPFRVIHVLQIQFSPPKLFSLVHPSIHSSFLLPVLHH